MTNLCDCRNLPIKANLKSKIDDVLLEHDGQDLGPVLDNREEKRTRYLHNFPTVPNLTLNCDVSAIV